MLFDNNNQVDNNVYSNYNGVKVHENSRFLYKSTEGTRMLKKGVEDILLVLLPVGYLTGFLGLPSILLTIVLAYQLPWALGIKSDFTFHAELLPHTEQIAFHKISYFGGIRRVIVDINNLVKVDKDDMRRCNLNKISINF